jgi:prephenate dehydrogenase
MAAPRPLSRFAIVGGLGQVGRLFSQLLASHGEVVIVDPAATAASGADYRIVAAAVESGHPDVHSVLAAADIVLLTLPEAAALSATPAVAEMMKPGALLADTLSVKAAIVPLLAEWAGRCALQACSLAPMFGPALGMAGRPLATITVAGGDRVDELLTLIGDAGARLVATTAEDYDRLAAVLQGATHAAVLAFGSAVARSGCDIGALLSLAPPPHLVMLALLARIVSGVPEVYWDIQMGPHAAMMRGMVRDGLDALDRCADHADYESFAAAIAEVGGYLGPHRADLAEHCVYLLQHGELYATRGQADDQQCQ